MLNTKTSRKHHFTPLRYPGGKTSLFNFFDDTIKKYAWKNVVYIEPYAGGAGAALALLLLEKVDSIIINDYDSAIYAFWKSILDNTDEFINLVETTPLSVQEWEAQRRIYNVADRNDLLRLGFATFYLNRTNRSGVLNAGPIGGKNQTGNWKMDARYNKSALIHRIKLISSYKDRIIITNDDGNDVIRKFASNSDAFFYIDPPYFIKGAKLYLNSFTKEHHEKLANTLREYRSSKWLLSYDNVQEICDLYDDFEKEVFSLKYSVHHNTKSGDELMVYSDAVNPLRVV